MSITSETLRLLGVKGEPDGQTLETIAIVTSELASAASFAYVSKLLPASISETHVITEQITFESHALSNHLRGSIEIILFAATLGINVDRLMRRYSVWDIERAAILQASAAALLEEYADTAMGKLAEKHSLDGLHLTPRFSPGYGDLPLEYQKPIVSYLDAQRKIGLTVTESFMLAPTKSITAIIGVSNTECKMKHKCADCEKTDCIARRL